MFSIHSVQDLCKHRNGFINLIKFGEHTFPIVLEAIFNSLLALLLYFNASNFHDELPNLSYTFRELFEFCLVFFLLILNIILFIFKSI